MKTVLVTGGLGFIFSRYIETLLEKGYKVVNVDKISYASRSEFVPKSKNYSFIHADVGMLTDLPHCDYIIHAASESHVDKSLENSDPFIHSNILGTYNILELLKNKKIEHLQAGLEYKYPKLIYVSTDETFGEIDSGGFFEEDERKPGNPYSASKAAGEMLVRGWGKTFDIPYCITNCVNIYGPHQHPEKLIPHTITQLLKGGKVKVHGDGSYVRCWLHVDDKCDAIYKIMKSGKVGESYNIGSLEEYSVLEVIEIIAKKFNKTVDEVCEFVPNRVGQDVRYCLDFSKITQTLKWEPSITMAESIGEVIKSYK